MSNVGKSMVAFGLLWILVWCLVGFYVGSQHEVYLDDMEELASAGKLGEYWTTFKDWKAHSVAHSHALYTAFIAVLAGLVMPYMGLSAKIKWLTAIVMCIGVILASVFSWFLIIPILMAGEILIAVAILISFIGVLMKRQASEEQEVPIL